MTGNDKPLKFNLKQYEFANLMVNELALFEAEFYLHIGKEPAKGEIKKLNLQQDDFYDLAIDKLSSIETLLRSMVSESRAKKFLEKFEDGVTDNESELLKLESSEIESMRKGKLENIERMIRRYANSPDIETSNNTSQTEFDGMIPELGISVQEAVENPQLLSEKLIKNFYERFGHYFENYRPGIPG